MAAAESGAGPVILFTHGDFEYEYLEHLDRGPYGEALLLGRKRTRDNILQEVIIKCLELPPGEPSAATLLNRARLDEEAQLAEYLKHRAVVRVLFRHEAPDAFYTVREFVRGPTLEELVTLTAQLGKCLSEAFILYVGAELASALAHVHTCEDEHGQPLGIVHRNINPASIVFTWRGEVKLADYSLASSKLSGRRPTTVRRPRGSLFFTAPETLFDGEVEPCSDLFSLGLVLLELATGRHLYDPAYKKPANMVKALTPHERKRVERAVREAMSAGHDDTTPQAFWGAATFTREDVARAAAGLSDPMKALLDKLLRKAPGERFQTAEELEDALRARLAGVGSYDAAAAVAELRKTVAELGAALVVEEVTPGLRSPSPCLEHSSREATTR